MNTFVWKKRVQKDRLRLQERIRKELPDMLSEIGVKYHVPEYPEAHDLKKLRKKLGQQRAQEQIEFVYGTGKRKSKLQKVWETVNECAIPSLAVRSSSHKHFTTNEKPRRLFSATSVSCF